MDWRHHALCRDEDPELFFPIGTTGPAAAQVEEAKLVCARCTVTQDCLDWALDSGQDSGVWGGTSEDERRALKRSGLRPGCARPEPRGRAVRPPAAGPPRGALARAHGVAVPAAAGALGVLAVLALALLYSRLNDAADQAPGVESGLRAPVASPRPVGSSGTAG